MKIDVQFKDISTRFDADFGQTTIIMPEETEEMKEQVEHIRKAIWWRGGEISTTAGLDEVPKAILNIPADTSLAYYEDNATAYQKVVPANVNMYAMVSKIGGMTRKSRNILGGEALADDIVSQNSYAEKDTQNKLVYIPSSGGYWEFTDFKPNTQYTIILYGRHEHGSDWTHIVVNGEMLYFQEPQKDSYAIYTNPVGTTIERMYNINDIGAAILHYEKCGIFEGALTVEDFEPYFTEMRSAKTTEFRSEGANGVIDTFAIPEAIQSLEGYGEGLDGTYCNTVDFAKEKYLRYIETKILDGTGTWKTGSVDGLSTNYFALKIEEANTCVTRMCVSDMYERILINSTTAEIGIDVYDSTAFGGFVVAIRPHNAETYNPTTLKAMLAENPVTLKYARLVPIEEDISDLISNKFIEVEGGGSITAVNEYKYAVPSTIKYVQEVGS